MEEPVTTSFEELKPPNLPQDAVYTSHYCEENVYLLCQLFSALPDITENWLIWAVFVSNIGKKVALFSQKAARKHNLPVVWDYHVILLLRPKQPLRGGRPSQDVYQRDTPQIGARTWVYDFDTLLPVPCPWEDYLACTFPSDLLLEYTSSFRVISAPTYLSNFVSDRSHMLVDDHPREPVRHPTNVDNQIPDAYNVFPLEGERGADEVSVKPVFSAPPPAYEALCGLAMKGRGVKTNLMSHFVCMEPLPGTFGDVLTRLEIASKY